MFLSLQGVRLLLRFLVLRRTVLLRRFQSRVPCFIPLMLQLWLQLRLLRVFRVGLSLPPLALLSRMILRPLPPGSLPGSYGAFGVAPDAMPEDDSPDAVPRDPDPAFSAGVWELFCSKFRRMLPFIVN